MKVELYVSSNEWRNEKKLEALGSNPYYTAIAMGIQPGHFVIQIMYLL